MGLPRISLPPRRAWGKEIKDIVRGSSGGFLFGIPLLYTMEVWWIGSYTEPFLMLAILVVTFIMVFLLNRTDGFRQVSGRPWQAAMDSIEALAIGIICVTTVLILLQEVTPQTPLDEALGKIVLEGMPFAIGVALAGSIMQGRRDQPEESGQSPGQNPEQNPGRNLEQNSEQNSGQPLHPALADLSATLVGTVFIAFNIAPTDEVTMLAAATSPAWLITIVVASLCISYCIVFAAGFTAQDRRLQQQGLFQQPLLETVMAYLISLCAAAMMLWFFHRLGFDDPWTSWLKQTLILGLPAAVGGAAGRLAV